MLSDVKNKNGVTIYHKYTINVHYQTFIPGTNSP